MSSRAVVRVLHGRARVAALNLLPPNGSLHCTSSGSALNFPEGEIACVARTPGWTDASAFRSPPARDDCVKTWDYVASRTLPEPARPTASSTLRFDYTYDPVGHVTSQVRTLAEPDPAEGTESPFAGTTTLEHAYDRIGRLTETTSSGGVTDAYSYDPAGNRTGHTRAGDVEFEQVAAYDAAGQVRQSATSGDVDGSASYEYDRAGNRTRQVVDGSATSYRYDATSRLTSGDTDGRSLDFGYDALGRRTTSSDTSEHGTLNSTQHWSGMVPSGISTAGQNAVALVRDVTGELTIQASAGEVSWELLDRLASTVASTDETGQLTQLAAYSDHGMPRFDTTGWDARLNFTGEPDDPTAGTTAFYARNYDTTTGTFTTRDLWRGLQKLPQTLRYAYVLNDPATYIDVLGYRIGDPGSYNVKTEAKSKARRGVDNATNIAVANNRLRATGHQPVVEHPNRNREALAALHLSLKTPSDSQLRAAGACPVGLVVSNPRYSDNPCSTRQAYWEQTSGGCDYYCAQTWRTFGAVFSDYAQLAIAGIGCTVYKMPMICSFVDAEAIGSALSGTSIPDWWDAEMEFWSRRLRGTTGYYPASHYPDPRQEER